MQRADYPIIKLLKEWRGGRSGASRLVMGHSRLITNGLADNQPVIRDGISALHNGIIVNEPQVWTAVGKEPRLQVDTEVIPAIAAAHLEAGGSAQDLPKRILELCQGVVNCALTIPRLGKLCLFTNNGSLYFGSKGERHFASGSCHRSATGMIRSDRSASRSF